jgi:hypothetical protein
MIEFYINGLDSPIRVLLAYDFQMKADALDLKDWLDKFIQISFCLQVTLA